MGVEALRARVAVEDRPDLVLLGCGEAFGASGGAGSAQRFLAVTSEPGTPGADGDFSDPELLRQVKGGAAGVVQCGLSGEPPFFLLSTGEAAGPPGGNGHTLCY